MPTGTKTIRILMCDDHAILREGVATLLLPPFGRSAFSPNALA
jgi:hypothetical protein